MDMGKIISALILFEYEGCMNELSDYAIEFLTGGKRREAIRRVKKTDTL